MVKLLSGDKVSFFDYFYLFIVIVYAGLASQSVRDFGDIRTVGNAVALLFTAIFAIYKRVRIKRDFLCLLFIIVTYSFFVITTTGSSHFFLWLFSMWLIYFSVAYVICKGYGYIYFILTETILYHLAIIGIICWIFLLIIPVPFTQLVQVFAMPAFNDKDAFTSANILVYTVILSSVYGGSPGSDFYSITRNSGFAWEPGAFACFMCLAIGLNLIRTNMRIRNNIHLYVFLLALASTQSTTGYGILGVMLVVWLLLNRKFYWLIAMIPIILLVMNLPFMGEKLEMRSEGFSDVTLEGAGVGQAYDRILSIKLLWDEFLMHPIFGYGYSLSEIERLEIQTWSGLGRLLAQYGSLMTILFFYCLVKSSRQIGSYFSNHNGLLISIPIFGSMISYMLWTQPFFIAIWLSSFFMKQAHPDKY